MIVGEAHFMLQREDSYLFSVTAWIDHFETWYDGFKKKVAANVDVRLELLEGINFLKVLSKKQDEILSKAIRDLEGIMKKR